LIATAVVAAVCVTWLGTAGSAAGQESPAAKATRKKLKQKITVEWKELPIKEAVGELKREFDNRLGVKIDNVSGISNNSKVSLTAKDQPLEKILGELCDKYELGYYVVSNPKDRTDGWIVLRKSKWKERGYEGKDGDKGGFAPRRADDAAIAALRLEAPAAALAWAWRLAPAVASRAATLTGG
jgi:hypothetical protein